MAIKPSEEQIWRRDYSQAGKNFSFPRENIYDFVFDENKSRKDNIAIQYEGKKIKFGELFDKVEERTEFFKSKNVKDDDIITMTTLLTPDFIYDFYALGRLNAVSNLIDPRTSIEGIKKYIGEANSKLFITNDLFLEKLASAIDSDDFEIVINSLFNNSKRLEYPLNMISVLTALKAKLLERKDSRYVRYQKNTS